ncbi:hypothetical protein [Spirillospora sp. CA-294931]|uniref:hypothetical protein n=1 Tax=Spirillospora sp. CA-294931 TaxID=3240042 RepID=UPI003D8A0987
MTRVPDLAAPPEIRLTENVYELVFGGAPSVVRRAPGALVLLTSPDGPSLTVALRWGATVALGPTGDGSADLYSMNHHTQRFVTGPGAPVVPPPPWARVPVEALLGTPRPGARMVVNRDLPAEMGLLDGAETFVAVTHGVRDLYGHGVGEALDDDPSRLTVRHAREAEALLVYGRDVRHVPCDLASLGLRLLIMDVGAVAAPPPEPGGDLAARAASALSKGRTADLGALLTEGHVRGEPTLDVALDVARAAGAHGGLIVGRCAIALTPMTAVPRIRAEVTARLKRLTKRPPRFLTAVPEGQYV